MVKLSMAPPQLLLLDLKLPDMDGMEILKHVSTNDLPCEVIVVTAHGSVDIAVDAMHNGAFDFLVKPFDSKRLLVTVENAIAHQELQRQVQAYRDNFDRTHYEGFIGESLPMQSVYRIIDSAASSQATVFVTGESGTGKEVCAAAIHQRSQRASRPFIALNCGAIPKDLMESEIFGHVKGAFTGANSARDGAALQADGGTLFLDEVCEMNLDLQTKLLRFIQSGTIQPVGGSETKHVDVRFVCATNRDPWEEVEQGRFREDLYYRLHVIPIQLPPLRDRETDVKLLIDAFLAQYVEEEGKSFQTFDKSALSIMMSYDWPGNVRQLQNIVRNIVVLNQGEVVLSDMIPNPVASVRKVPVFNRNDNSTVDTPRDTDVRPLWEVEKDAIEHAILMCDGNIPKAAALLDVSASTLYRKREKWQKSTA
jgi:two-component system repressor protein LuxO